MTTENKHQNPVNRGKTWTDQEEKDLLGYVDKKLNIKVIATNLGRTMPAVHARLCLLASRRIAKGQKQADVLSEFNISQSDYEKYLDYQNRNLRRRTCLIAKRRIEKGQNQADVLKELKLSESDYQDFLDYKPHHKIVKKPIKAEVSKLDEIHDMLTRIVKHLKI